MLLLTGHANDGHCRCQRLSRVSRQQSGVFGEGGRRVTEAEWLMCENPLAPLAFVAARATDRKRRLFLCACCARVLEGTPTHRRFFRGDYPGCFQKLERALSVVEQFAEGFVGSDALAEARRDAEDSVYVPPSFDYGGESGLDYEAAAVVAVAVEHPVAEDVIAACWRATDSQSAPTSGGEGSRRTEEARWQAMVLRDVFGDPFRQIAFSPQGRTSTAVSLAAQMYQSRDFGAMPILADALQDAGCDAEEVLAHCRGPGLHVRGCWVVDLVLGKE